MQIHPTIAGLRHALSTAGKIAFVPTMGNLHEGHLSLMRAARRHADCVVASIFVNRLQFAPNEDFASYPRTAAADAALLRSVGVDCLFAPDEAELYPEAQQVLVEPPPIQHLLEGEFRPGHYRGVATVVLKLLNIVQPQVALFGLKDYQQLMVIRTMVRQLALPVEIIGGATVRADDGLALSSRNGYLSATERAEAPRLFRLLRQIREQLLTTPDAPPATFTQAAIAELQAQGWAPDYLEVRRQSDLLPSENPAEPRVLLAAARLGKTRLIDNIEI